MIFEISTFTWGGTTALDPHRVDRRGYHVYILQDIKFKYCFEFYKIKFLLHGAVKSRFC